ncbi:TPA: AbrB/MazE/SpoVT family DNA-binding domain-containing protein [Candidatus Woesearchaeota archaeon]|nr:AbrB/MazE/SpoVT family DNA-binding domain-containing protein [Candidatus Woesearchaeota archaeon]HIH39615.1 AbrB/MazE/SpoVT family DNA-binding domain-containing protein [Candidatus Woesearchaeota archaeon]
MEVIETRAKDWGNSLGIVIPKEIAKREHLKNGKKVKLLLISDTSNVLKETFGSLKNRFKKSSQQMKDEIRAELYND